MIIKVATGKDENNNIQWTPLYAAAIRNRLRRDNNLSDVTDIVAARENLGIDSNFVSIFQSFKDDITQYVNEQIMKEGEDVATVLAQISDILTALTLRLSSWENALTTNWGGSSVDLENYLYYVGEMANFPESPQVGWTVCIDGIIYLYTGSAWVQLNGTITAGGGSGTIEGGGGSGILPYPAVKYDNYSIPKVTETFPVLVDADQCRYRLIFPLEAAPTTEQGLMISGYNTREAYTHYVKGRFAMHGSNAVLYLPKSFAIQNNDRAMTQRIFPPEGVTRDPIDISNDLTFEYDAMPPSSQYIVVRLTSSVLNSIRDTWGMANITGMRLVLDYSYAQGLAVGSDVTVKIYRFVPEGESPLSNESTILPKSDLWKMWLSDDELRLSEPTASYNSTLSYVLNGQYPIEWQEAVNVSAQYASPLSYSYSLLGEPMLRLSDISTTTAIYRSFSNAAYTNLAIACWSETEKKGEDDDIKPLPVTTLPPFQEPSTWITICQGIDEPVGDDETLVSLEFEIFAHKQVNKVFAVQENLNLSVDHTRLYQWGTNKNSNYLSLYLPADFMTKRGANRDITFELLDGVDDSYIPKIFLLPSEYGKMYVNWSLYNNTFPGVNESLREIPYAQLSDYKDDSSWQPFTYVMKKTNDGEQVIISIDKNLVNTYVNDLPYDITNLAFDSTGKYMYTSTGGYGTHQTNKRLLLQWKVKRHTTGQAYYYEKYMWQHKDQALSKTSACFDVIAKQGTETTRYNKIVTPIDAKNKLEDGNAAYGQITISDGDVSWKYSDSSHIRVVSNGDTTNTTTRIRTLSYAPVNNVTNFYYEPENLYVRLIYNKLLNHFGSVSDPPPKEPDPPPSPSPGIVLGIDKKFDDGFPDLLDICKYTLPARNYKFIFTLEDYSPNILKYGYNAYRIQSHNTKHSSVSDITQCDGTEGAYTQRKHQVSGRFMYNQRVDRLDNTSPPALGASLFLPESFFDEAVYEEMFIAIRAPQGIATTTVNLYNSTTKPKDFIWLRNADKDNDEAPSDGSIVVYKTTSKHKLTWSSTCTYQTYKSTDKFSERTPYPGYRVIHVPQETLDRITGGWNCNVSKKNLSNLQLMISYTLKSSIFSDLELPKDQMNKIRSRQVVVRNLVAEFFKDNYTSLYTTERKSAIDQANDAQTMKHFVFAGTKGNNNGGLSLEWPGQISLGYSNRGVPRIILPYEINNYSVILQNRYIAGASVVTWLTNDATRKTLHLIPGKTDMSKILPGQYYDMSQLSSVNRFVFDDQYDPSSKEYYMDAFYSHIWIIPQSRYPDGIDTDAFYMNESTVGKFHNTAMIIYEEP